MSLIVSLSLFDLAIRLYARRIKLEELSGCDNPKRAERRDSGLTAKTYVFFWIQTMVGRRRFQASTGPLTPVKLPRGSL